MRYRKFGNTDLNVSEIGFGAWAIGGGAMIGETAIGWGEVNDDESKQAISAALNAGINFFDTADIYGLGHSEKILGETVGRDKNVIIATKVGNVSRDNKFTVDYSKKYILSACDASLKRLGRETIDYYQLHTARLEHLKNGECVEAMNELRSSGKIRWWGLSLNTFYPMPEAEYLLNNQLGNGFQLVLNIINQKSLPLLKTSHEKGFGIIARMPLQFGLLTGKFEPSATFPDNDHRQKRLTEEVISFSNAALQTIWKLCKKYDISKTSLALSYALSYPEVSTAIPGIRTAEHVQLNTTGIVQLDKWDIKLIEEAGKNQLDALLQLIRKQG